MSFLFEYVPAAPWEASRAPAEGSRVCSLTVPAPERLGHYRILSQLGQGGMGIVYAAHDERLDRRVALKLMREQGQDEHSRRRFRREARTAAAVRHPNVCLLHDVGEEQGLLYIAMELLEGRSLEDRLRDGPLPIAEAVSVGTAVLSALQALHEKEVVHRDLKPSNVFLTPHGVKLLDFGLARPLSGPGQTETLVTQAGALVGTPHYMAPEQLEGQALDARTDLFALGALLFETMTGRKAFSGTTLMAVLHATLYEHPPALTGSPAAAAVDRVLRRALSKRPDDRYASASAMAEELQAAAQAGAAELSPRVVAMTRLIVLPLRILRPDPDTDFLAVSLADAITNSLSSLESLVVRSNLTATRLSNQAADLKRIASEAEVDVVLSGTLLRAGEQVRVSAELVEAPGGAVLWSHTAQVPWGDVFQLQDTLVTRIVESLALRLTAREQRLLKHDVPASARAYEFYLRGLALSLDSSGWEPAREMFEQAIEQDSRYAPGWARLGRVCRLLAKFTSEGAPANLLRAEAAFRRALQLNPDLAIGHNYYAQFEVEAGRTREALARLLRLAQQRDHDADVFAGLVHVCRYAGLLEPSLRAHERAVRLDPTVRTSVSYTHWLRGQPELALAAELDDLRFVTNYALISLGREAEALASYRELEARTQGNTRLVLQVVRTALQGDREGCVAAAERWPPRASATPRACTSWCARWPAWARAAARSACSSA